MSQNIEQSDTFGNYLIHGIEEIHLPELISWLPSTPGWYVVFAALLVWLGNYLRKKISYWWHNRYRGEALRQLQLLRQSENKVAAIGRLPELLKVTALQAFPRPQVASLTGGQWLAFLDSHYSGPSFQQGPGALLVSSAYQPADQWQCSDAEADNLFDMCQLWIESHQVVAEDSQHV